MSTVVPLRRPRREPARSRPEPLWREAVGAVLRDARRDRDQRIADVAERAGIAPQYLSEVERGRKDASSEVLSAVAGALDLTVREVAARASRRLSSPSSLASPGAPLCRAA